MALFKAELDPGVHLVEHGDGIDRVLDRPATGIALMSLAYLKSLALAASIPYSKYACQPAFRPFGFSIEPARERETSLDESAVAAHRFLRGNYGVPGSVGSKDHRGRAIHREAVRLC